MDAEIAHLIILDQRGRIDYLCAEQAVQRRLPNWEDNLANVHSESKFF